MVLGRVSGGATLALFLLACDGGTGPRDVPIPCQQTYEFGNFGCTEIQGTVTNPEGIPLPGISVHTRFLEDQDCCIGGHVDTDCEGKYRLRVHWMKYFQPLPDDFVPDTLTFYVRASRRPNGPSDTLRIRDSILTQFRFAPVGEAPPVRTIDFLLPVDRRPPICG